MIEAATKERRQVAEAWGDWVSDVNWDHFTTLTFTNPTSPETAKRHFLRWTRHLEQRSGQPVNYLCVTERGGGGMVHILALVHGTSGFSNDSLKRLWPMGRVEIRGFDAKQGGSYYVTKSLGGDVADYDITIRQFHA